ncbi:hypothetical protein JL721_6735 [Aureococcus anophagefferens]|nr:hypothetical protein JL721_6735 [Aureococcus anophagefferens]
MPSRRRRGPATSPSADGRLWDKRSDAAPRTPGARQAADAAVAVFDDESAATPFTDAARLDGLEHAAGEDDVAVAVGLVVADGALRRFAAVHNFRDAALPEDGAAETFPGIRDGSVVFLKTSTASANSRVVLRATLVRVDEKSRLEKFASKRLELSLLKSVAEACGVAPQKGDSTCGVAPWSDASVELCEDPEASAAADFCEFWFKDQFVSRADMWRFKTAVVGRALHVGKVLDIGGMRAAAHELRGCDGSTITSAVLSANTRLVFRTRSTRLFWLVQMSFEMWEPTGGGGDALHVERLVDGFAAPLLERWRAVGVNHSLSVLFARVDGGLGGARDLYKVVLENEAPAHDDAQRLVAALKRELVAFARSLARVVPGNLRVCRAADGNVLEAINLTLNVLDKHYMDRDVQRTGNSIVLVSAGCGVLSVDARLAQITKQRMMDNGIGMDMLSLAVPPLHTAPIFMHRSKKSRGRATYEVPHWINLSFVDPDRAAEPAAWIAAAAPRRARDGWRMATLDLGETRTGDENAQGGGSPPGDGDRQRATDAAGAPPTPSTRPGAALASPEPPRSPGAPAAARPRSGLHASLEPAPENAAAEYAEEEPRRFVNPFRKEDESDLLKQRSHNRRRWSHVFPIGSEEFRSATTRLHCPGPNWKSLITPAVLPVETDYLPDEFGTGAYEEANHSVLLPPDSTTGAAEMVAQMVAQRIAGDYQLVLSYNGFEKRVDVRSYRSRHGNNADESNRFDYEYALWCGDEGAYASKTQTFLKYPSPETNWNTLDQVISGFLSPAATLSSVKFRRMALEHATWRDEWLALECDSSVDDQRCYRLALHWLLCSGWVVEEFLSTLCRKAKQLKLNLVQVPEYSIHLDIHPFIAHASAVPPAPEPALAAALERALHRRLDFVRDSPSALVAAAAAAHSATARKQPVGAPVPRRASQAAAKMLPAHAQRQYLHRSGRVFVRVLADGSFAWVKNRLANPFASDQRTVEDGALLRTLRRHAAVLCALLRAFGRFGAPRDRSGPLVDRVADYLAGPRPRRRRRRRGRRAATDEAAALTDDVGM